MDLDEKHVEVNLMRSPQGLKWQKARRLLLRLDKRGEDKAEGEKGRGVGEKRKEEEKKSSLRRDEEKKKEESWWKGHIVEGIRKSFEQGLSKDVRSVDPFQPRITRCESLQPKVNNYYFC